MVHRTRSGSHLRKRGGVWYYRRVVPPDARRAFGRAEVSVSLDTSDEKHAKRLERLRDADFERRLEEARAASDLDALARHVARATPIDIGFSSKWGGVSGEHVTDEDWLMAMSLAIDHLGPRSNLTAS